MMNKMQIFDFLGMTKDGEVDNEAAQRSMKLMAEQAAKMSQFEEPNMELMKAPGPMTNMDAQMMQQQMPNPYAPVNYMGPQTDADAAFLQQNMPVQMNMPMGPQTNADAAMMQQYAPQNMSMQQIMTMLKRAGY